MAAVCFYFSACRVVFCVWNLTDCVPCNMGATVDGRLLVVSPTKELSKALIVSGCPACCVLSTLGTLLDVRAMAYFAERVP